MASFLIVDDKEIFVKNTATFLENNGDTVRIASSGAEAITALTTEGWIPDAVMIDYRVSDMAGSALIATLRALDSGVPILVISGVASIELAVSAIKAGANDFLVKPLSLTGLRERLLRLARQQQEARRKSAEATDRAISQLESMRSHQPAVAASRARPVRTSRLEVVEPSFLMVSALSLPG